MRAGGLYATNALEAQLDLLYTYCQYEFAARRHRRPHLTLYRGINRIDEHEILAPASGGRQVVLFNNLNSIHQQPRARRRVRRLHPRGRGTRRQDLLLLPLLPGMLKGEDEYLVIGGVYEVTLSTL